MTTNSLHLFYQTLQGPNDGLKDWYYHFTRKSGDHFVMHELNHVVMYQRVTKRQQVLAVGEFMVEFKHPQKAKDMLHKEIDNVLVTYVRPFGLFRNFSSLALATETFLLADMHLNHATPFSRLIRHLGPRRRGFSRFNTLTNFYRLMKSIVKCLRDLYSSFTLMFRTPSISDLAVKFIN